MDPDRFARMKAAFERQGGVIRQDDEARRLLDHFGANAITYNESTMVMKPDPTATEVFEEFIHVGQHRHGRVAPNLGNVVELEIEATQKLIRNRKAYGIPNAETRQTIRRLRALRGGW